MITVAFGSALEQLLARATSNHRAYSEIVLCSPFIDRAIAPRLRELCAAAARSGCAVTIITTPGGARQLSDVREHRTYKARVIVRDRVHTKAYLMRARGCVRHSEALITSANLTRAGLRTNAELGVHVRCTSVDGRRVLEQVGRSLRRLTIQ